ncbi:helix-turn-helix transcriptional regulator [Stenotrophomonas forensis]|jgi:transcriptional regulator with XRE-family HTH domain|uniref:helix-turn-helix domain-containing protein n=1 Tax=Stenotrophomonas forensis TaxID=2871169 RepID=UPI0018D4C2E5|nr:helix-turn-helix transcriptional regulator [Stenotrophomonas maltophilia]MBH1501907.1 helix-turn-helix transcriptional regulator [Stenotrophomonas maltophilia]MBH1785100.1 helix-turn-helix transcriptional regulator [Stenotrophomonas maltophilia]
MSNPDNDWLEVLRAACKAPNSSQRKVAERLGYSTSVINQVLSGKYNGDLKAVQTKVEGVFMGLSVNCPVVGDLPRNRCLEYQRRDFAATNHIRVQLARACPSCKHFRGKHA